MLKNSIIKYKFICLLKLIDKTFYLYLLLLPISSFHFKKLLTPLFHSTLTFNILTVFCLWGRPQILNTHRKLLSKYILLCHSELL